MSYARSGPDSDVYIFPHIGGGVVCCACGIGPEGEELEDEDTGGVRMATTTDVLAHLERHR